MAYGTQFTSFNAIRRRMAQSSESVSPGFIAMIESINESTRTVDCLVQGSPYYLRNVRYATTFEDKPSYIKVRGVVYIRRSSGNKMSLEVEGPAYTVPSVTAIDEQFPENPVASNAILEGLQIRPSASPGMSVAVSTGKARFNGVITEFGPCLVGESQNAKVNMNGGTVPGIPKVGNLYLIGSTYTYLKISSAPSAGSGTYRYDQFELGSDLVIDYRSGTAAATPTILPVQSSHLLLGTILVRPGATAIYWDDVNTQFNGSSSRLFAPSFWQAAVGTVPQFSVSLVTQDGSPLPGTYISIAFKDVNNQVVASPSSVYGSLSPYPGIITDNNGYATFSYDTTGATKSVRLEITQQSTGASASIYVYIFNGTTQLPF